MLVRNLCCGKLPRAEVPIFWIVFYGHSQSYSKSQPQHMIYISPWHVAAVYQNLETWLQTKKSSASKQGSVSRNFVFVFISIYLSRQHLVKVMSASKTCCAWWEAANTRRHGDVVSTFFYQKEKKLFGFQP